MLNEQYQAEENDTGMPVRMQWEKMYKSKNGVDPLELFFEHSVNTIRLSVLSNAAPRSPINWCTAHPVSTFDITYSHSDIQELKWTNIAALRVMMN